MTFKHFPQIAQAVYAGSQAGERLQSEYKSYIAGIARKRGAKQNSAAALARRTIVMLENLLKKNEKIATWSEAEVQSTLLDYLEQQEIVAKIRHSKTLQDFPASAYVGLEESLRYYISDLRDKGALSERTSDENLRTEATGKALLIFWDNIQKPDFQLTSTFTTYLLGIGRRVLYSIVRQGVFSQSEPQEEDFLPEYFETHRRERLFEAIREQLRQLRGDDCRNLLLEILQLSGQVLAQGKISQAEMRDFRKVAIQELGKLSGNERKRPDKDFEKCRKRFVIESFPKIQAALGPDSPFSPEYIAAEVRLSQQKLERERLNKRKSKAPKAQ